MGSSSRNEHIEMVFGRFRDGVREGQLGALASAALVLFAINLFALIAWTVACAFIVPLASLFFGAWAVGIDLPGLHGSSFLSVFLLLIVVGVEWVTIVLSAAAGTSIGLATICPARVGCSSRWPAFKRASTQAMNLYVVILAILAIQTVVEILYVRQVLLMGGTGVPLAPY
ncbi:MAG: hypothetical protein HZB26_22495 [Candidatus Hydrogenedentes bacterium]|nr:hypothetical protein [Candidatus Hydrogenedentota bacterium]